MDMVFANDFRCHHQKSVIELNISSIHSDCVLDKVFFSHQRYQLSMLKTPIGNPDNILTVFLFSFQKSVIQQIPHLRNTIEPPRSNSYFEQKSFRALEPSPETHCNRMVLRHLIVDTLLQLPWHILFGTCTAPVILSSRNHLEPSNFNSDSVVAAMPYQMKPRLLVDPAWKPLFLETLRSSVCPSPWKPHA